VWAHSARENHLNLNGFLGTAIRHTSEKPLKRLSPETWPHHRAETRY